MSAQASLAAGKKAAAVTAVNDWIQVGVCRFMHIDWCVAE